MNYKIGGVVFISYRTKFSLVMDHCLQKKTGEKCNFETRLYERCNQENCNYRKGMNLVEVLRKKSYISGAYIYPPELILPSNSLLMPIDYLKLMTGLYENIRECEAFIRFDMDDADNFWTLLERTIWRRLSPTKIPEEYHINSNNDSFTLSGPHPLVPMDKDEVTLWTNVKMYIVPEPQAPGMFFGRYCRNCFLLNCPSCNRYFTISKRVAEQFSKKEITLSCPFCRESKFSFTFRKYNFFNKEWLWLFDVITDKPKEQTPITPNAMISLLFDDTKGCPKNFPLICGIDEDFPTEAARTADVMSGIWLIKGGINIAAKAFGGEKEGVELRYKGEDGKIHVIR